MRWAYYDLKNQPPSHDFVTFCHYARYYGAQGIWFGKGFNDHTDYLSREAEKERASSILVALCEKYGFEYKFDRDPHKYMIEEDLRDIGIVYPINKEAPWQERHCDRFSHRFHLVKQIVREPMEIKASQAAMNWASDRFKGRNPIVVSIRNAKYQSLRNSSPDWYRWAKEHEAEIIPDYLDERISLDRLIACYDMASLNIGVHQGRGLLNWFSYRPYLVIKHIINEYKVMNAEWVEKVHCLKVGEQMPWATKQQKILWNSEDDYETIEREYQTYLDESR